MKKRENQDQPGPVGWLLAGALIRNASRIARAMIANELDLRDWMTHDAPIDLATGRDELWFDYIADTGDAWFAMNALAAQMARPHTLGGHATEVGEFVFVGGDTAYHVADETTVRLRFVSPFQAAMKTTPPPLQRRLFGIPGNHDYYDNLVGFNRMFRKPLGKPPLQIDHHEQQQQASYVRILLPGAWELWGVDLGPHGLDYRQKRYFRNTLARGEVPAKLILAVPTPPITFDHVRMPSDPEEPEHVAYRRLFGIDELPERPLEVVPERVAEALPSGACRLHIAGDDHNYQRYGGRGNGDPAPVPCAAAIVSGGGGAFLHPTETSLGAVKRVKTFPTEDQSREVTARLLRNPWTVARGGYVWLVGAILGGLLYATFPHTIDDLGPPALYVGAIALGIGALWIAHKRSQAIARARKLEAKTKRPDAALGPTDPAQAARQTRTASRNPRTLWPVMIVIALGLPFGARALWPAVDPLAPESVFLVIVVLFVVLLGWFGKGGNGNGRLHRKIGFATLGVLHAVVQVGFPVSIVMAGSTITIPAAVASWLLFAAVAPALYRNRQRWALLVLWLVQGPAIVAACWLVGEPLAPRHWLLLLAAAGVGLVTAVVQYGWYMLVASAFDGHNNEVGSANRVTGFKQWIRFHVTAGRLTGYVIAIPDPESNPTPVLVDVFHVEPKA